MILTTNKVVEIAKRMAAKIPPPMLKKPRETKSFRQLKLDQQITNIEAMQLGAKRIKPNTIWQVHKVNSTGALLKTQDEDKAIFFRLTSPEWKKDFKSVRKTRKKETSKQ